MSLQQEIIERLGVKPVIDVDAEIRKRVDFLKEHVKSSRTSGLLIAISGGIDSAVTAGLCKRATDEPDAGNRPALHDAWRVPALRAAGRH